MVCHLSRFVIEDTLYVQPQQYLNGVPLPRERCPYSEFLWSVFSHIQSEYLSTFIPNAGKYGPEKLLIRAIFTECSFSC